MEYQDFHMHGGVVEDVQVNGDLHMHGGMIERLTVRGDCQQMKDVRSFKKFADARMNI